MATLALAVAGIGAVATLGVPAVQVVAEAIGAKSFGKKTETVRDISVNISDSFPGWRNIRITTNAGTCSFANVDPASSQVFIEAVAGQIEIGQDFVIGDFIKKVRLGAEVKMVHYITWEADSRFHLYFGQVGPSDITRLEGMRKKNIVLFYHGARFTSEQEALNSPVIGSLKALPSSFSSSSIAGVPGSISSSSAAPKKKPAVKKADSASSIAAPAAKPKAAPKPKAEPAAATPPAPKKKKEPEAADTPAKPGPKKKVAESSAEPAPKPGPKKAASSSAISDLPKAKPVPAAAAAAPAKPKPKAPAASSSAAPPVKPGPAKKAPAK